MKNRISISFVIIIILIWGMVACIAKRSKSMTVEFGGMQLYSNTPVSVVFRLGESQMISAKDGRLGLVGGQLENGNANIIPMQLKRIDEDGNAVMVLIFPEGRDVNLKYELIETEVPGENIMLTKMDSETRQMEIEESGKKILQYNYQTVYEKDVIRLNSEKLEEHIRSEKDTFITTSIYAVPRSDYIHPLFGLEGEMLTRDWPDGGHPHHRAIFWAWPEVTYGSELGDIYALQRIFARPTGKIEITSGLVFAQIEAENLWMWEDSIPIVKELATIKVYRASSEQRIIDLEIRLDALEDSISIATRNTDSYGGLNLRMMTPDDQEISYFTDEVGANPNRAWSDFSGIFKGNNQPSGLMVLQHKDNPEYPGKWVEYPDLAWVQPTFPTPETRYPLSIQKPFVLQYRLLVHKGGKPDVEISRKKWDAYHIDDIIPVVFNRSSK